MNDIWTNEEWKRAERRDPTKTYIEPEKGNRACFWGGVACFVAMPVLVWSWVWWNLSPAAKTQLMSMVQSTF